MIELRLTIDEGDEPVTGHVATDEEVKPTPFIGYVELISAVERARAGAQAPMDTGGGEAE